MAERKAQHMSPMKTTDKLFFGWDCAPGATGFACSLFAGCVAEDMRAECEEEDG